MKCNECKYYIGFIISGVDYARCLYFKNEFNIVYYHIIEKGREINCPVKVD